MSRLVENAEEIGRLAAQIQALAEGFNTKITLPDDNGSYGPGSEAIRQAAKSLQKTQEALKTLMLQTVEFLKNKGAKITEADVQEAAGILKENKFFG